MGIVYHGTSVEFALQIARDGEVLSPLEKKVRDLRRTLGRTEPDHVLAARAFSSAVSEYGDETRIRSVSVTPNLCMANAHAAAYDQRRGGVVLGIELEPGVLGRFGERWMELPVMLLPGKVGLEGLKVVRLSTFARELEEAAIHAAFDRYAPLYEYLCTIEKR
jgi:hypothetical protein